MSDKNNKQQVSKEQLKKAHAKAFITHMTLDGKDEKLTKQSYEKVMKRKQAFEKKKASVRESVLETLKKESN